MSTNVVMLSPDGKSGEIPAERVSDAKAAGFKPAYQMYSPDGKSGYIPEERVSDAMKAGFTQSAPGAIAGPPQVPPQTFMQKVRGYGGDAKSFVSNAASEAGGLAKGIGNLVTTPPQVSSSPTLNRMAQFNPLVEAPTLVKRAVVDPAISKYQSSIGAFKSGSPMEGTLGAMAAADPLAPDVTKLYEQSRTDTSGAAGRGATDIASMFVAKAIPDLPESVRARVQNYLRIGPQLTKDAVEKWGQETADALAKHQEKVDSVAQANEDMKGNYQQRQKLLSIADTHTASAADKLPQIAQAAKDEVSAKYDALGIKGTRPAAEVDSKLAEAVQSKLQGSENEPPVIKRIRGELQDQNPINQASVFQGAGPAARGMGKSSAGSFDALSPKAQAMMRANNPDLFEGERGGAQSPAGPSGSLDFGKLQGYATEIGEAMRGTTGDVHAALTAARYSVLEPMMREMAEADGKTGDYLDAKDAAKKYHNTFNNTAPTAKGGSPIARALATKDPITGTLRPNFVQAILTDDKAYPVARQLLDRYNHLGAGSIGNDLEVAKSNLDGAAGLPKTPRWTPEPGEAKIPADVDPQALKAQALKQTAEGMGSMKGIRGPLDILAVLRALKGDPEALAYPILRRAASNTLLQPKLSEWLSRPSAGDAEAMKTFNAKKIALKAAQKAKP